MPYSCLLALFFSTMSTRSLFLNNKCLVKESKKNIYIQSSDSETYSGSTGKQKVQRQRG